MLAAEEGDAGARDRLVEAFMPSIASVARIYRGSPAVDRVELMQEGVVGLLRALQRYDPTRGTPFWAYASWWVRQAMQQLVAELTRPVVLSDRALRQLARVKDARRDHLQAHGREPSSAELAETTGLTREQVENLVAAERRAAGARGADRGRRQRRACSATCSPTRQRRTRTSAWTAAWRSSELRDLLAITVRPRADGPPGRFGLDGREQTLREVAGTLAPERGARASDRGARAREAARGRAPGRRPGGARRNAGLTRQLDLDARADYCTR